MIYFYFETEQNSYLMINSSFQILNSKGKLLGLSDSRNMYVDFFSMRKRVERFPK